MRLDINKNKTQIDLFFVGRPSGQRFAVMNNLTQNIFCIYLILAMEEDLCL